MFNPTDAFLGNFQYIEFMQLSSTASFGGGLNEFQVIAAVLPEPSSVVLGCMAACGLIYVVRRRK